MGYSADFLARRPLGRTGLMVSRLGIGAGYNVPAAAVEKAYHEHGVNYFYWGSRRTDLPIKCYRFVLSNPDVDLCLCGPRSMAEMDEALLALAAGPLSSDELARARRIGDFVHG